MCHCYLAYTFMAKINGTWVIIYSIYIFIYCYRLPCTMVLYCRYRLFALDQEGVIYLRFSMISLCNPRDHCTHSLCQDCYTVELITSNIPTYLHMGITLWLGVVLYALVPETMHGIIVGKRVRTRQLSDRYCTRVWMSGMFWCDQ